MIAKAIQGFTNNNLLKLLKKTINLKYLYIQI